MPRATLAPQLGEQGAFFVKHSSIQGGSFEAPAVS